MVSLSGDPGPATIPPSISLVAALGCLLMGAGAMIALVHPALLASPFDAINGAVRVYAGYVASRNGVLAIGLLAMLALRAGRPLGQLLTLIGLMQLADAVIDCFEGRWMLVPGVCVLGVLFLMAAGRLSAYPVWSRAYWR